MFELDHLVVAAQDLDEGTTFVQSLLGVTLEPGGEHTTMGTHNRLLNLGDGAYLEVIAADPDAPTLGRPRWYGLDSQEVNEKLKKGPMLLHWAARAKRGSSLRETDIARDTFGRVTPMQRGDLSWLITIPDDGHLPGGGVIPTLLDWGDTPHPTTTLPDREFKLTELRGFHPEPQVVEAELSRLGLEDVLELHEGEVRLEAAIRTPGGDVILRNS